MKMFGQNQVIDTDFSRTGSMWLSQSPYQYKFYRFDGGPVAVNLRGRFCIAVLNGRLTVGDSVLDRENQFLFFEGHLESLTATEPDTQFVAIGLASSIAAPDLRLLPVDAKKVEKPWGYEIWVVGPAHGFAFKKIFIKAKTKTSLQFHEKKIETNFIYDGRVRLHYAPKKDGHSSVQADVDIESAELNSGAIIHVLPFTIHRLEALTDLMCYEASTVELDDVIRISDDNNRPSGFIASEHNGKK